MYCFKLPHLYKWSDSSQLNTSQNPITLQSLLFADILNNTYMLTIQFLKNVKILYFEKCKVKGQIWRPWKHTCAELGHWKGHFVSFGISIEWALCLSLGGSYAQTMSFFDNFGVFSQNYSGHKAIKFGRNTYLSTRMTVTQKHH
jgi:hypothetical protein